MAAYKSNIFYDLCILKTKILEVFEDLMIYDEFSENQEEKLFEAFNFLEQSLSILSDLTVELKSEPIVHTNTIVPIEKDGFIKKAISKKGKRKREQNNADVNDASQEGCRPPEKKVKISPKKSSENKHTEKRKEAEEIGDVEKLKEFMTICQNIAEEENNSNIEDTNKSSDDAVQNVDQGDVVLSVKIPGEKSAGKRGRGRPKKLPADSEAQFKGDALIECPDCKKTLCTLTELDDHVCYEADISHGIFACQKCDLFFKTKSVILSHMAHHIDKVSVNCRVCAKTFKYASALRAHSHGDEASYRCKKCEMEFANRKELNLHAATHKLHKRPKRGGIQMAVPFTCHVCNVVIKSLCNIQRHLDTHNEKQFFCEVCDKRFTRKDHLKDHMKIHTGIRPRMCELCGKGFLNTSDLKRHMRVHTGSKPYVCDECGRGFTQKCTLDKHLIQHQKKAAATKPPKPPTTSPKSPPSAARYSYKQMMKDFSKTPGQVKTQVKTQIPSQDPPSAEESLTTKASSALPSCNTKTRAQSGATSKPKVKSRSKGQVTRPQLFTLLTNTQTTAEDNKHVTSPPSLLKTPSLIKSNESSPSLLKPRIFSQNETKSEQNDQKTTFVDKPPSLMENMENNPDSASKSPSLLTPPPGVNEALQMVETADGVTHVILPEAMEVGQEVLVFMEKGQEEEEGSEVKVEDEIVSDSS